MEPPGVHLPGVLQMRRVGALERMLQIGGYPAVWTATEPLAEIRAPDG